MVRVAKILFITYIGAFTIGLFSLFILGVTISFIASARNDLLELVLAGLIVSIIVPGAVCVFVFLPIILIDTRVNEFALYQLIRRYLPLIIIPLAAILCCFIFSGLMYEMVPIVFVFIYYINGVSLYLFCGTLKSNTK
jgi:hypothetical protein